MAESNHQQLQQLIEQLEQRPELLEQEQHRLAVEQTIAELDAGRLRVAEKREGEWVVNAWVKRAILSYSAARRCA